MRMNKSIVVRLSVDELNPLLYSNAVSVNNYIYTTILFSVQIFIGGFFGFLVGSFVCLGIMGVEWIFLVRDLH